MYAFWYNQENLISYTFLSGSVVFEWSQLICGSRVSELVIKHGILHLAKVKYYDPIYNKTYYSGYAIIKLLFRL